MARRDLYHDAVRTALEKEGWNDFFQRPFIQKAINRHQIELIIFNPDNEIIIQWIK